MPARAPTISWSLIVMFSLIGSQPGWGQQPPAHNVTAAPGGDDEPPPVPQGVEVLARGPVHEAFATLTAEPVAGKPVAKKPPAALDEMPPDDKPDGDVIWVSGYWHWDDERKDFLWVSGIWRTPPPGKRWVAGYWRDDDAGAVWVGGFWTTDRDNDNEDVTYLPAPPAVPNVAPPSTPPGPDTFYVPGHWVWRTNGYAWQAGYWARVQPDHVWVSAHYRWTPSGYVFIPGYWDLSVAKRGVLYAPIYVDAVVAGPTFVYTPTYVVRETVVLDSLFVRPSCCHYYFGDYYEVKYRDYGFENCVVYSRRCYDPIFVYERWEHRHDPRWEVVQFDLVHARVTGRAPVPPRTLVQQNIIVQKNVHVTNVTQVNHIHNNAVIVPAKQLAKAKGVTTLKVDAAAKAQVRQQAQQVQAVAQQRRQAEVAPANGKVTQPRVTTLNVPRATPLMDKAAKVMTVKDTIPTRTPSATMASQVKRAEDRSPPGVREGVKPANFSPPVGKTDPQPVTVGRQPVAPKVQTPAKPPANAPAPPKPTQPAKKDKADPPPKKPNKPTKP